MDAAKLESKIYAGYGKAAQRIGYMANLFRPSSAINPLAASNRQRAFHVSFNAEDMKYRKPNKHAKPIWYGVFDGRLAQVGDYLVSDRDGTFFVASMQTALPIMLVQCNRTINVLRPQQQTGVGAAGYGGDTDGNETELLHQWPASILQGTKGEKNDAQLPGDTRSPWWAVLLPHFEGVTLRSADLITDDLARRYVISSAELTDLGWRITAMQAQT